MDRLVEILNCLLREGGGREFSWDPELLRRAKCAGLLAELREILEEEGETERSRLERAYALLKEERDKFS
ncbi:hypothetical protein H9X85_05360 [Anaerotignum lactatifermentans]|uniref:Uncharacterized protein n=1 Tax=Anaerotignum lactatifermentans TaxID=160404 RepID=A0ABS2G7Y2_9FIRM|nr:hypothetical protein [Anaerotignum lactatifermentans]MBM6829125.1 hypothetical protein [Anaerotignum lactatifermentans]MBM6877267.1 hypothetical protein [Anaerotignum lactatifermentans]MBM6950640.1 hypothetical protein [Anaerotignum lactatifermentans]